MDQDRFDNFVAALGTARPRRSLLAALGGVAVGLRAAPAAGAEAPAAAVPPPPCAKKHQCGKTCCKPGEQCIGGVCGVRCSFTTVDTTMTLDANCVATSDITVPPGMTLDGNGRTIKLAGKQSAPPVILVTEGYGQVRRLTLDARRLTGTCPQHRDLIQFAGSSGVVEDVTIRGLRCGTGISAVASSDDQRITIARTAVEGTGLFGISLVGSLSPTAPGRLYATIQDSQIRGIGEASFFTGVYVLYNAEAQVHNSTIAGDTYGIMSSSKTVLTAADNTITRAAIGIGAFDARSTDVALTATGNRITGPDAPANAGILADETVSAVITNNSVSNFRRRPDGLACGIRVTPGDQLVTVAGNAFVDLAANEFDICA